MGTTANRAIPYVEPADQLNVYPAADKAKADRIDALFGVDTGWLAVTIQPGFAADPSAAPMMRRIGNIVYLKGGWAATGLSVSQTATVGVFPASIPKPVTSYHLPAGVTPTTAPGYFLIGSGAGTSIQIRTTGTLATAYYFHGTFTLD